MANQNPWAVVSIEDEQPEKKPTKPQANPWAVVSIEDEQPEKKPTKPQANPWDVVSVDGKDPWEPQAIDGKPPEEFGQDEGFLAQNAVKAVDYVRGLVRKSFPGVESVQKPSQEKTIPERAVEMTQQATKPILAPSAPLRTETGKRLSSGFGAGAAASAGSMAAALPAAEAYFETDTPIGKAGQKASEYLSKIANDLQPNDTNFADQLAMGAGSMATFMLPSIGVGGAIGSIPRMGTLAVKLAPAIQTGVSTVLESATEAGGVYQDMVSKGINRDQAAKAASHAFFANLILVGITNKFGIFGEKGMALKKALISAPLEGIQEAGQSIIASVAKGEPINWEKDVIPSAGVGVIIGGGVGAMIPAATEKFKVTPQTIGQQASEYLRTTFPALLQTIQGKTLPLSQEQFNGALRTATAAGEEVLLAQGTPQNANKAAVLAFAKAVNEPIRAAKQAEISTKARQGGREDLETLISRFEPPAIESKKAPEKVVRANPVLADVVQSLGMKPHELNPEQYAEIYGKGRSLEEIQAEHAQEVEKAHRAGEPVPEDILSQFPGIPVKMRQEKAREAAQKILKANKIDNQVMVNLVDSIVADNEAFKLGYGETAKAEDFNILGVTYPAGAKDRIQAVIELAKGAKEATGRHEAFHAVTNTLLDEGEKNIILKQYGDMEAAANAFGEYRQGKAAPSSAIQQIFDKIVALLNKMGNYFKEGKFTDAESIFRDIERGRFADRIQQAQKVAYSASPKLRVAIRLNGEQTFINDRGETHAQIIDRLPAGWEGMNFEIGYVDNTDNWVSNEEAVKSIRYSAEKKAESDKQPFFSQLQKTLEEKMPNRASAEQIKGIIGQGVKAEEIEWSGLNEWLASRADYSAEELRKDIDQTLIPSRRKEPKVYTERMALRRSLQRQQMVAAQAAREGIKDVTNIKKNILSVIQERLPLSERGRFLSMLTNAKTPWDMIKAINRVDEQVEIFQKKTLVNSIKRETQRIQASKMIAIDYVQKINGLMENILTQKPRQETIEKYAELQKYVDARRNEGVDVTVPQYVLDKLRVLTGKPLIDMSVPELEDFVNKIHTLAELGKTKLRVRQEIDDLNKEKDLADIMAGSVPLNSEEIIRAKPGEKLPLSAGPMNIIKKAMNLRQHIKYSIRGMDVIADVLDGMQNGTGPNSRIFKARPDAQYGLYLDDSNKLKNAVIEKSKSLKLNEQNYERIGVYAIDQQVGGRDKLYNNGLVDEEIENLKKLTPNEMEMYNFMRGELDKLRPKIAETMKEVYNKDIGEVKSYFPFVTDWDMMSNFDLDQKILDEMMGLRKNVPQGFTKERKGAGKQKVNVNALDVYLKHVDDVAYLTNMGATIKYLGELASSDVYGKAVGNYGQQLMREWLDVMAKKGGSVGGHQIKGLDVLRVNVGAATLAFKLAPTLIQVTPLGDGAALIGNYAFKGAYDIGTSREWRKFLKDNFPEIRNRGGDAPEYMEFTDNKTLDKMKTYGFWALQKLDLLTASSIAAGAYQKYMAEHGKDVDLSIPNKDAVAYAQRVIRRTQSSPYFKDVPLAISRGKLTGNRSLDRAIFQFQNFILNRWTLLTHEGFEAGIKKGNISQSANILFWTTLTTAAGVAMRRGIRDISDLLIGYDDEHDRSYIRDFAREILGNIPFIGQIVSMGVYGSMPAPALDSIAKLSKGLVSSVHGKEDSTKIKGIIRSIGAVGRMAGIAGTAQLEEMARKMVTSSKSKGRPKRKTGRETR